MITISFLSLFSHAIIIIEKSEVMPMDTEANKPVDKLTVKDYVYLVSAGVSNAVLVMLGSDY